MSRLTEAKRKNISSIANALESYQFEIAKIDQFDMNAVTKTSINDAWEAVERAVEKLRFVVCAK